MSFMETVGLTTHKEADEVAMGRMERRSDVLTVLTPISVISDPESYSLKDSSAKQLITLLAPGKSSSYENNNSLPNHQTSSHTSEDNKESTSLQPEFSNKTKFLDQLGLQSIHSFTKQKGKCKLSSSISENVFMFKY